MEQQNKNKCPICFQKIYHDLKTTPCSHCYHSRCIDKWFIKNTTCPVCRFKVKEDLHVRQILTEEEYHSLENIVNERLNTSVDILPITQPENNTGGVFENNIYMTVHSSNSANSFPSIY